MRQNILDMIGRKFGKLQVISYVDKDKQRNSIFLCLCDCGIRKQIRGSSLRFGNTKSCGCQTYLNKKLSRTWKGHEDISATYWSRVINTAKRRNIKFDISIEFGWQIFENQNSKCKISGLNLSFGEKKSGRSQTASLDRIDSSKGYIEGNVQWVHKDVNRMKSDFSEEYLFNLIRKIHDFRRLSSTYSSTTVS